MVAGSALPRDLVAIKQTLSRGRDVRAQLDPCNSTILNAEAKILPNYPKSSHSSKARSSMPRRCRSKKAVLFVPVLMRSSTRFAAIRAHAKDWIAHFEAGERRRTGIQSLESALQSGLRLLHRSHQVAPQVGAGRLSCASKLWPTASVTSPRS